MKNVKTREDALSIIKCFATCINNGESQSREDWNTVLDLMKKFNISLDDIK